MEEFMEQLDVIGKESKGEISGLVYHSFCKFK